MSWAETMKQQAHAVSTGTYRYTHRREGGADIHDVFIEKSVFRVLFSCIGAAFLLGSVCCALLSKALRNVDSDEEEYMLIRFLKKESLCLSSFWSVAFSATIAKWLHYKPVKKESLIIMPDFGVQLEQHFWSGRAHRQFVPVSKILKPVLNECVTPVTCYWSLALLVRDEDEIMLVFKKLHPPVKMLVPIWKALCAFTNSDSLSPPVVLPPDGLRKPVDQDGVVESWVEHGNIHREAFPTKRQQDLQLHQN